MQKTFSFIKVCCLYEHDGKLDISSMDDILPVMIYVVAKAQVIDFPVYVKIIDDYIKALETNKIVVKVRRSRGKDIDAACGQLANKS